MRENLLCDGRTLSHSFFCSWSGGKDSCLALYRAIRAGGRPARLLTMLAEGGERSRSHGLGVDVLRAQAAALGIPIAFRSASWSDYEESFLDAAREMKSSGLEAGVFGDIDLAEHREWVERVCAAAGVEAFEPLWGRQRRELLEEFIAAGFVARIVVVREDALDESFLASFLGRTLDRELVAELESRGVDASGEKGEYHTVVTDGPLFARALEIEERGRVVRDGCRVLDLGIPM
jgi:diphthine-ammonia ligase